MFFFFLTTPLKHVIIYSTDMIKINNNRNKNKYLCLLSEANAFNPMELELKFHWD